MKSNVLLNVDGEMKYSHEITYDELVLLCKDYIKKYGKTPKGNDFKSKNNLPTDLIMKQILDDNNISMLDFLHDLGETSKQMLECHMNEDQINQKFFPFQFNENLILYYDKSDGPESMSIKKVHVHDQDGYKYYLTRRSILQQQKKNHIPSRFGFKDKTYLEYNINNFLKINQTIFKVYRIDKNAKYNDLIEIVSDNGDILKLNVRDIYSHVYHLTKDGYSEYLNNQLAMNITKEKAIEIIKIMEKNLGRPLLSSDFSVKTSESTLSHWVIERFWGNFTNMVDELCLEKNQYKISDYISFVENVCDYVKLQGRDTVSIADFDSEISVLHYQSIYIKLKEANTKIQDIIKNKGLKFQKSGTGYNHVFDDGERVMSYYEYMFSTVLRNTGHHFRKDYYKDVKYSEIINGYSGKMTCDYALVSNERVLYIELAGILGNKSYQEAFLNNTVISNSNSAEKYRLTLQQKNDMFSSNNFNYLILLRNELTKERFESIINDFYSN